MAFIAKSRRNHLWFGTSEHMDWFPTPLRGADVSPTGWSASNDLLNGGGHQLNSAGSHKNYIFEWSGASSRDVAQRMVSYSQGSYGRGLIYFLDPLTWDTNVLPAMWADPSMGVGYEGATLVYGIDPLPAPTSNWRANELPVTSAFYNLSGVTPGWRGKEDAVFVPIPEGYSLSLGAFYQFSGSGGLFYRTQSQSGALGDVQGVTPLPNDSSEVLNTLIGGSNVSGVWLFVGRSTSANSSVTLTAMIARLIETSKTVSQKIATNLFTNPNLVGDGTYAEVARFNTGDPAPEMVQPEDFRVRDLGTGESVMEIERVAGLSPLGPGIIGVSTRDGKPAARMIALSAGFSGGSFTAPLSARPGGTIVGTSHVNPGFERDPALSQYTRRLLAVIPEQASETPQDSELTHASRLTYAPLTSTYLIAFGHAGLPGTGDVWWTDIGLFAGDYDGPAFAGDSSGVVINGRNMRTQWDGAPDNSTSSAWTMTPAFDRLKQGPWMGGQGHSGCRFVGKPTYINNTGVDGGQVGFAATFKEVGSWLYG